MTEIEVAMVGRDLSGTTMRDLRPDWFDGFWDGENERAWDERRRVTLTVGDDETLNEIFGRAIEAFGIYEADWSDWRADPNDPRPDPGVRTRRFMALRYDGSPIRLIDRLSVALTIPDDEGCAVWSRWHYEVPYGELVRAAHAGSVPGDPTQVYLLVRPDAAGGGILHSWQLLVEAWEVADQVARVMGASYGTYKVVSAVRRRLAGRNVVGRETREWLKRNGHADYLTYMLRGEPWAARDLAGLLGCTADEAEAVLALYGYERDEAVDKWVYVAGNEALGLAPSDLSARVVAAYTEEVWRRYWDAEEAPRDELEALFREILKQASETGEVRDVSHVEWDRARRFRIPRRARLRETLRQLFRRR